MMDSLTCHSIGRLGTVPPVWWGSLVCAGGQGESLSDTDTKARNQTAGGSILVVVACCLSLVMVILANSTDQGATPAAWTDNTNMHSAQRSGSGDDLSRGPIPPPVSGFGSDNMAD